MKTSSKILFSETFEESTANPLNQHTYLIRKYSAGYSFYTTFWVRDHQMWNVPVVVAHLWFYDYILIHLQNEYNTDVFALNGLITIMVQNHITNRCFHRLPLQWWVQFHIEPFYDLLAISVALQGTLLAKHVVLQQLLDWLLSLCFRFLDEVPHLVPGGVIVLYGSLSGRCMCNRLYYITLLCHLHLSVSILQLLHILPKNILTTTQSDSIAKFYSFWLVSTEAHIVLCSSITRKCLAAPW